MSEMGLPDTLGPLHRHLRDILKNAGLEAADLEARLLIRRHAGHDFAALISSPDAVVPAQALGRIETDLASRLSGRPLSRIFGEREFWGLKFALNDHTLDPRPDTETIVEIALRRLRGRAEPKILDLGTGTGCILIALLSELPAATGVGVDLSYEAAGMAARNAAANGVVPRARFVCGSWMEALGGTGFDLVVSNPPYIPRADIESLSPEVRNHDPILALSGGEDGFDSFRLILKEIPRILNPAGICLFEAGFDQASDLSRLVADYGLKVEGVHTDLSGNQRVVEISRGDNEKKF